MQASKQAQINGWVGLGRGYIMMGDGGWGMGGIRVQRGWQEYSGIAQQ